MRKIHTIALALLGVALGVGSLTLALGAGTPPPTMTRRAIAPLVAGDDSFGHAVFATPTPLPVGGCAGLRSDVKTLTDGKASFSRSPQASSVFNLVEATRPAGITDATARVAGFEDRVVELSVNLNSFRRTSNGGIELVISAGVAGDLMAAIMPGPGCLKDTPTADAAAINAARIAVQQACGNPPDSGAMKPIGGTAKLRGVPFWGTKRTDGTGAPSGVELGPALSFEMTGGAECNANPHPTPTATPTVHIDEILLNLLPQVARRGETVQITVITVPAASGVMCHYDMWDDVGNLLSSPPPQPTDAEGHAIWQFTVPADMPLGAARVAPRCEGVIPIAAARFTIVL
jgi:hypothetical protein